MALVPDAAVDPKAKETLSQFLARVLDQLSVTSWLPAIAVVAIGLTFSEIASNRGDLSAALDSLQSLGFSTIALLVGAVLIAAMFTQAFEFEAIRFLEGYWATGGLLGRLGNRKRSRKLDRLAALRSDHKTEIQAAFNDARPRLRDELMLSSGVIDALESYVVNKVQLPSTTDSDKATARRHVRGWKLKADPVAVARIEDIERRISEYPGREHRVLPTTLGNVIRSAEDRVHRPGEGRLENFALHVLDSLPRAISVAYREQRRRLDLYCTMAFILALSSLPAGLVAISLPPSRWLVGVAVVALPVLGTSVCYRAAIATGRKFGLALWAIQEHQERAKRPSPTG